MPDHARMFVRGSVTLELRTFNYVLLICSLFKLSELPGVFKKKCVSNNKLNFGCEKIRRLINTPQDLERK